MRSVAIPIGVVGFFGPREQERLRRTVPPMRAVRARIREEETMVTGQIAWPDPKLPVYRQVSFQNHPKKTTAFSGKMALRQKFS